MPIAPVFTTRPAINLPLAELADLFTRSFAGYFVPLNMTVPLLATMLRQDTTDLALSHVLLADGQPAGIGLIARRGWTSRLAAMAVVESLRGKGAGNFLMAKLIQEARLRRDRSMVLEIITANAHGLYLYEKFGFKKVRRLVGLTLSNPELSSENKLQETDIRAVANLICHYGLPNLPWQTAGETIAAFGPPARAYALDSAYAVITDPVAEDVFFRTLLVLPQARGRGAATVLVKSVVASHPGRKWHVPAIFPEEIVAPFLNAGFVPGKIAQWQMQLDFM